MGTAHEGSAAGDGRDGWLKPMDHILLAVFWIIWCAVHSGMISATATSFLKRRLGAYYRLYRLFFNIVAVATIVPVILYARSIESRVLFRWEGFLVVIPAFLLTLAGLLFIAGARHYDMLQFLGLRQLLTGASHAVLTDSGQLSTCGILGVTRHPWYLATVMLIWANLRPFTTATLVTNLVLTAYLVVGTILEERKLIVEIGDGYREYQKKVSMLFPFKWLRSRGSSR